MKDLPITTGHIPSLVKAIAIPASIGFFFQTMYNVVDTFYAGLLNTDSIAALSYSFSIFFLILALGSGIGTGANVLIANALGAKDKKHIRIYASQAIVTALIASISIAILGILISPYLYALLGASAQVTQLAIEYMNVIFLTTPFFVLVFLFQHFLSSQGLTKPFRNALIAGFLANLVLNPLFMFGFGPIPAMGLMGIGIATGIIQLAKALYLFKVLLKTKVGDHLLKASFMPRLIYIKDILHQGIPASVNMLTVALGIFIITAFVSPFSDAAVAAYGIAMRIEQMVLVPTIGLNIAVMTLVGQNFGAKKFKRVEQSFKVAMRYVLFLLFGGMLIILFGAQYIMQLFTKDQFVIDIGAQYLRIDALTFIAYGILFLSVAALQGMKRPMIPLYIGLGRQLLLPLVFLPLAAKYIGLVGIWWSIFAITWIGALIALYYMRNILVEKEKQKA